MSDDGFDFCTVFRQVEDYLFPAMKLNTRERSLYYHFLRHSKIIGRKTCLQSIKEIADKVAIAETSVRESIRDMNRKGCIIIQDRSRLGHEVEVMLPSEIEGIIPSSVSIEQVDIETLDFYENRKYVNHILTREDGRCFYCLRGITQDKCELDHVVSQMGNGDNSFRNIVASCHECNTSKRGQPADDFMRSLYRKGLLSTSELEQRLTALESLQAGRLRPQV